MAKGRRISSASQEYKDGVSSLNWAATIFFLVMLFQFLIIISGAQVTNVRNKAYQALLSGTCTLALTWMIIDRWSADMLPVIGVFLILPSFLLEIGSFIQQMGKFKVLETMKAK